MSLDGEYAQFKAILEPLFGEPPVLNKKYISPVKRSNGEYEKTPSFKLFEGRGAYKDRLYWRDWGLTNQAGSRPVDLLMALHGVSREEAQDMLDTLRIPPGSKIPRREGATLELFDRPKLTSRELSWWDRFHVSETTLREYNVYGVDSLYAGGRPLMQNGTVKLGRNQYRDRIAFSYRGGKDLEDWQFYCPDPKTFFRKGNFIYGWEQLPYILDTLVIVSGMKDGLCLYEATGLRFIAGSGEGAWHQIKDVLHILKRRAERIVTLFDPDGPGRVASKTFKSELGIDALPFKFVDTKQDIAALSSKFGIEWLGDRIQNAL